MREISDAEVFEVLNHPKIALSTSLYGPRNEKIFKVKFSLPIRFAGMVVPYHGFTKGGSVRSVAENFIFNIEDDQPFNPKKTWREILDLPVIEVPEQNKEAAP